MPTVEQHKDEPMWQIAPEKLGMGSYTFPGAGGSQFYAGPNPDKAPHCYSDNYLGLEVDSAPNAKVEGCYETGGKNPALDGPPSTSHKMDAKVGKIEQDISGE